MVQLNYVRLWELDAAAAIASSRRGWLALAPLLKGATPELVQQAAQTLLADAPSPAQSDLLATLGIFAEPLFSTERFIRMVTKERLMSSELISYLFKDQLAEFAQQQAEREAEYAQREAEYAQREAEYAQREAGLKATLQKMVEDAIIARFPMTPAVLVRRIGTINQPQQLEKLHHDVLLAPDLPAVEALIAAAAPDPAAD
jgi:hypothetical protein